MRADGIKKLRKYFIISGFLLLPSGFLIDLFFAGIPFQDAPEELSRNYKFFQNLSTAVIFCAIILILAGFLWPREKKQG